MKTKYLDLYKEWMKTGSIPTNGLCYVFKGRDFETFLLFKPDRDEHPEFYDLPSGGYWGYDGKPLNSIGDSHLRKRGITLKDARNNFTPFRQTLVLFMAAIAGEL